MKQGIKRKRDDDEKVERNKNKNFDEKERIKSNYLDSLKTNQQNQWVELTIDYKSYNNKFAKEI